jgi:hypothetical protein
MHRSFLAICAINNAELQIETTVYYIIIFVYLFFNLQRGDLSDEELQLLKYKIEQLREAEQVRLNHYRITPTDS